MPEHHLMRSLVICRSVLCALAVASCGGSSTTATTTPAATITRPTATSTSTTPASTNTSQATTPVSRPPRCRAAGLALSFLGQQGATGHGELGFALRNIAGKNCRTYGYPGVLFLDRAGNSLPTNSMRTTHDFFGVAPAVALVVAPGASISFRLGVTHGISSTVGCTTAYGLQVIPPDDTATLRTTIPQGAYECRTATLSPVRPGVSAYP